MNDESLQKERSKQCQFKAIELGLDERDDDDDDEFKNALIVEEDDKRSLLAIDGGEPEDQTFTRDLRWIIDDLNDS